LGARAWADRGFLFKAEDQREQLKLAGSTNFPAFNAQA
jgi:hypothetical protein